MFIKLFKCNIFLTKLLINFIIHFLYNYFQNLYFCIYIETRNKNTSQGMLENKNVKSIQMINHLYNNINFLFKKSFIIYNKNM
jgi:hypothetical protein